MFFRQYTILKKDIQVKKEQKELLKFLEKYKYEEKNTNQEVGISALYISVRKYYAPIVGFAEIAAK